MIGFNPMMSTDGAWIEKGDRIREGGQWMMGGRGGDFASLGAVMCLVTWFLVVALLVTLIRYFWKLADKVK